LIGWSLSSRLNHQYVGVVGSGQMGQGIAKVLISKANRNVCMIDINEEVLQKSLASIGKSLEGDVAKGRMTADEARDAKGRISIHTNLSSLDKSDFVIEAATENPALKFEIFRNLDSICQPSAILASNTSSISITSIAAHTKRAEKVIGMHFMNPVPVMKLVEIIPGLATSEQTKTTTIELAESMGKVTTQSRDIAGFIANRLLAPYLNEAVQALYEGLGTKEDIDTTLKLGCNMPMGPLTLADFIGLDTLLAIMQVIHAEKGDKYKPCPLLIRYVDAGWLGKKVGKGFFVYEK